MLGERCARLDDRVHRRIARIVRVIGIRGAEETRTPDPLLAKEVLYQLSYGPESAAPAFGACSEGIIRCPGQRVWAFLDSNQRPLPYQGSALTS